MRSSQVGIWTTYRAIGEDNAAQAAALVEQLGYGMFWLSPAGCCSASASAIRR